MGFNTQELRLFFLRPWKYLFFSPFFPRCRLEEGGDGHDHNVQGGFVKGAQNAKRGTFYGHPAQAEPDRHTILQKQRLHKENGG